jgi:DNA-directed RNA polymerase specialized sigma24 family protein
MKFDPNHHRRRPDQPASRHPTRRRTLPVRVRCRPHPRRHQHRHQHPHGPDRVPPGGFSTEPTRTGPMLAEIRDWNAPSESVIPRTSIRHPRCQNSFMPSDAHQPDFDALTRQHKDSVYRQMLRVCGNNEDAEDVLIEALLKAYRQLDQLRDSAAFRAWLAQIARRVCWQLKEREALGPLLQLSTLDDEGRELPAPDPSPEANVARRQMKQRDRRSSRRRSRPPTRNFQRRHEVAPAPRPRNCPPASGRSPDTRRIGRFRLELGGSRKATKESSPRLP